MRLGNLCVILGWIALARGMMFVRRSPERWLEVKADEDPHKGQKEGIDS
jgi:hypothetical protein